VDKNSMEDNIIDHISDRHGDADVVFSLVTISIKDFQDYLRNRDNSKFWDAIRISRNPSKLPIFV
jgi:hypothetical protein